MINKKELERVWETYKDYCEFASGTRIVESEKIGDFLGWVEAEIKKNIKNEKTTN